MLEASAELQCAPQVKSVSRSRPGSKPVACRLAKCRYPHLVKQHPISGLHVTPVESDGFKGVRIIEAP